MRFSLLLIDNSSNEQEKKTLNSWAEADGDWETLHLAENLGFAKGMNAGLRHCESHQLDYVCFLNNDTVVDPAAFCEVLQYTRTFPEHLVIGFHIKNSETGQTVTVGGYRYLPWLGLALANQIPGGRKTNTQLDYIDGAAFVVKGDFLRQIGGIPEDNFLYFEELNLAKHLRAASEMGFCESAVIRHAEGSTSDSELALHKKHYFALLACLRYTRALNKWMLPSVIIMRLAGLGWRSAQAKSPLPLAHGVKAVYEFFCT